ncbi:LuxR C-terminal-related transcriptional regulator [Actinoplanes sp. NEAU-A12]|uniref:LuxR C-terminal-related transcriptional regulator n=1 Tax=Actinoplanes sandaracinus TaxID=3045177 RepID=A0ABT6WTA8_9ACTN|nr:LuxR C-terminal-related transcriptional regulator [Actinoplanes sandaracinus]MDI6102986.1 LuxR C-terminal-related transcriptional regulator [Actinoplanes sandaracinus]
MRGDTDADRFVGRGQELTTLFDSLHRSRTGRVLVEITGEPGIGKTRLLAEFASWAAEHDAPVADTVAAGRGTPPRAVVIDDADRIAATGLAALEEMLRRPAEGGALVVLAYRPRQASARLQALRATPGWQATHLTLGALAPADAATLAATRACDRHRADAYAASGGNPRYLRLLAALCAAAGCRLDDAAALDLPADDLVPLRLELAGLTPATVTVARAAAVLDGSLRPELLARVAECGTADVLAAIDEMLAADVLRSGAEAATFHFRHPVLRAVAYHDIPGGWRLAAHRRAAEALLVDGAPVARLAQHIEQISRTGDGTALGLLVGAARAVERTAPATAAAWYQAALRLLTPLPEQRTKRLELLTAVVRTSGAAGLLDECREALQCWDEAAAGDPYAAGGAGTVIEWRATLARLAGRYTQARSILRTGIARLDAAAETGPLRSALAGTTLFDTGWDFADDALITAAGADDAGARVHALAMHAAVRLTRGAVGAALRSVHEAARLADRQSDTALAGDCAALAALGWIEASLERYPLAGTHLQRALTISQATGQWPSAAVALAALATVQLRQGRLGEAASYAERAVQLTAVSGAEDLRAMALTVRAQVSLATGAVLASLADSQAATSIVPPDGPWWRRAGLVHAQARLADGDPDRCVTEVLDVAGGDQLPDLPAVDRVAAAGLLSRAELARGGSAEALAWAERADATARRLGLPGLLGSAASSRAAATGNAVEALVHAVEAVSACTTAGHLLDAAEAHLLAGHGLLTLGEPHRAGRHLDAAEHLAARCGAAPLREEVARRRSAAAPAARPAEGEQYVLSQREYEIAGLVSEGRTNRQIARALEVSQKTVETHLARIFTKLDVTSRAQIANMVGRATIVARPRARARAGAGPSRRAAAPDARPASSARPSAATCGERTML